MMLYQNLLVNKKPTTRLIEWEFFIVIIFVIFKKAIIRMAEAQILEVFKNEIKIRLSLFPKCIL